MCFFCQWGQCAGRAIVSHLLGNFRTGNYNSDRIKIENPSQGELRQVFRRDIFQSFYKFDSFFKGKTRKSFSYIKLLSITVEVAVIVLGKLRLSI